MIGLLKMPLSIILTIRMKGNLKRTSRNTLSLLWVQNKDLSAASQPLLTKVKLHQQHARLAKTLLFKFDVNEENKLVCSQDLVFTPTTRDLYVSVYGSLKTLLSFK